MECQEVLGDYLTLRVTCLLYTGQSRKLETFLTSSSPFCSHVSSNFVPSPSPSTSMHLQSEVVLWTRLSCPLGETVGKPLGHYNVTANNLEVFSYYYGRKAQSNIQTKANFPKEQELRKEWKKDFEVGKAFPRFSDELVRSFLF